eukprot:2062779-Karenia_brevis.AAC.1
MVVGGLQGFDSETEATEWLKSKFDSLKIMGSRQIESRADIAGMLFCTFISEQERNMAVSSFRDARLSHGPFLIWVAPSLPL